jgi:hypothetical protein
MNAYKLLITSPTQSRVWAIDTLEQAEHRLAYMVSFYRITHDVNEISGHCFEANGEAGKTVIEIMSTESETVNS